MYEIPDPALECGTIVTWLDRGWVGEVVGANYSSHDQDWHYLVDFGDIMYENLSLDDLVVGAK